MSQSRLGEQGMRRADSGRGLGEYRGQLSGQVDAPTGWTCG